MGQHSHSQTTLFYGIRNEEIEMWIVVVIATGRNGPIVSLEPAHFQSVYNVEKIFSYATSSQFNYFVRTSSFGPLIFILFYF